MTVQQFLDFNNTTIRIKTAVNSISTDNVADALDNVTLLSTPDDIEFLVGDAGFPADGDSTITLPSEINRVRLIRGHVPQSAIDDGGDYYSFNPTTKVLTIFPNFVNNELIQIQPY